MRDGMCSSGGAIPFHEAADCDVDPAKSGEGGTRRLTRGGLRVLLRSELVLSLRDSKGPEGNVGEVRPADSWAPGASSAAWIDTVLPKDVLRIIMKGTVQDGTKLLKNPVRGSCARCHADLVKFAGLPCCLCACCGSCLTDAVAHDS